MADTEIVIARLQDKGSTSRAEVGPAVLAAGFMGFMGPVEAGGAAGMAAGTAGGDRAALEPAAGTAACMGFSGEVATAAVVMGDDEVAPKELPPNPYLSSTEDSELDGLDGVSTAGV